jgi:hypothetical protein
MVLSSCQSPFCSPNDRRRSRRGQGQGTLYRPSVGLASIPASRRGVSGRRWRTPRVKTPCGLSEPPVRVARPNWFGCVLRKGRTAQDPQSNEFGRATHSRHIGFTGCMRPYPPPYSGRTPSPEIAEISTPSPVVLKTYQHRRIADQEMGRGTQTEPQNSRSARCPRGFQNCGSPLPASRYVQSTKHRSPGTAFAFLIGFYESEYETTEV